MLSIDDLDPQNSRSARRSLIIASIFTLFIANLTFISSEFSFFGFVIEISHGRIVAVGRIAAFLLLVIFLLKETKHFVNLLRNRAFAKLDLKHKSQHLVLMDSWGGDEHPHFGEGMEAEFQALAADQAFEKSRVDNRYSRAAAFAAFMTSLLINYALPVTFAVLAVIFPFSLDTAVSWLAR